MYYRPFLLELLEKSYQTFDLRLFTSSEKEYADVIVKQFDPDNKYFKARWYKKSCHKADNGMYLKDLSQLGLPLDRVVLVDNSTFSFGYQLCNGVPILSYTGATADMELMSLFDYLQNLAKQPDVRKFNLEYFKLHLMLEAQDPDGAFDKLFPNS